MQPTLRSEWYAVAYATPNAAAASKLNPSGTGRTEAAGTAICSANAPTIIVAMTRSPTRNVVTPSPTADTTPANSLPGVNGGGTEIWYSFDTISASGKLSAAAMTSTTTSPGPGVGVGRSSTTRSSSAPCCRHRTALIAALIALPSRAGEARRASFEEGGRAFLRVVAVEDFHERCTVGPRRLDARLHAGSHEALRDPERERSVLGDRRRERDRGVEHLGAGHHTVHDPELVRTRGLDGVAGEDELERDRERQPHAEGRAAAAGDETPLHLGHTELGVVGRDHEIATHEQL